MFLAALVCMAWHQIRRHEIGLLRSEIISVLPFAADKEAVVYHQLAKLVIDVL